MKQWTIICSGVPVTITMDDKGGTDSISINEEVQELKNMFSVQQEYMLSHLQSVAVYLL